MAEKVRFELTVLAYTRVPGVHLKPLGHLSVLLCLALSGITPDKRGALSILRAGFLQEKINDGFEKTLAEYWSILRPRPHR